MAFINPNITELMGSAGPASLRVLEFLEQTNPFLQHAYHKVCNHKTTNKTRMRTSLPVPDYTAINGPISLMNTGETTVTDTTSIAAGIIQTDVNLAELSGDTDDFLDAKAKAALMGFNKFMAQSIFYASSKTNPLAFNGLATRYSSLPDSPNEDRYSSQVIDAGGTGSDNASIWIVNWSPDTTCLIYPSGMPMGFQHNARGVTVMKAEGENNKVIEKYTNSFKWAMGIAVQDTRACVRIANIDYSELTEDTSSGANLYNLLIDGMSLLDGISNEGRTYIYMPKQLSAMYQKQQNHAVSNSTLTKRDIGNAKEGLQYDGNPIHACNALLITEQRVV